MKKVVMLINDTTYAYNLRGAIINRLVEENYDVVVVCKILKHKEKLEKIGAKIVAVDPDRHGTNPLNEIKLLKKYKAILKKEKPDVVLTYNIKPNVYGGMICQKLKIPYIPNITGLGTPVENPGKLQKLAIALYKKGVKDAACVFFQNEENRNFFVNHKMLRKNSYTRVVPGSGVDLEKHPLMEWPDGKIHFLYAARVMKEKGIDLFLAAARRYAGEDIIFDICGRCDDEKYRQILKNERSVIYHGEQNDMNPFYAQCSCFLYPSYYPEGMSNVLLEAAASGRPIIAADRAGCRETLNNEETGFIVAVNDEESVIKATGRILELSVDERKQMGLNGRRKIEKEFDRKLVVQAYMEEINKIIGD